MATKLGSKGIGISIGKGASHPTGQPSWGAIGIGISIGIDS